MSVFVLQGSDELASRKIDYQRELNQEQLDVVLNAEGPCLVLAGAGSGKTRTVTYRVAYLLEHGVDPARILLLTFTNKAAREMLSRVQLLLGDMAKGIWGGTFHSTANRILRSRANELGYTSRFSILDQDDAQSLIKAVMKELKIDPKARRFPTAAVVSNILSYATNTRTSVQDTLELKHPNFYPFSGDIEEIGRQYAARKREANAMDFDDLLVNWAKLMSDPNTAREISSQFQYVLVDEYQDTNALQDAIVDRVASVHKNLLVVGDDAQSIYAFRGADVKNILRFPEDWADAKIFKLLTNYRSVPEILDLANASLEHNVNQFQKELIASRGKGEKPKIVPAASARQEAQFVAEQILALRTEGVALANMAVLFRSSSHSQALEFELLKRDIPYEYRGGMKFFARAHIKDVLSYLRVSENPQDEAAWLRVMNLQTGIGAGTASSLTVTLKQIPDFEKILNADISLRLPVRARQGWEEFAEIARRMMTRAPSPGLMLRAVLDGGYRDYLEREYPDWRERLEDIEQLAVFAESTPSVSSFLADIALYDDVFSGRDKDDGGREERIVLSTIHQAKGLEWDTVFIIHLADSAFPHRRAMGEEGGLEEERRLFYVAVTRARRKLFLTYPVTMGTDTLMLNQPSLFLEELPPYLTERMELRDARAVRRFESRSFREEEQERDGWSWDAGSGEPTIDIDRDGNRSSSAATVWKSSPKKNPGTPPTSFLRDVDDL
ncbi:MAG: UvrD-helicase domain-containing protein [Patescibacteria group bacterium]